MGAWMFDWDQDYSELVEGPKKKDEAAECCSKPSHSAVPVDDASSDSGNGPGFLRRNLVPLLLSAVFLTGVVFEKTDIRQGVAMASVTDGALAFVVPPTTESSLPAGLLAYDEGEYRRFMAGLRGMNIADLHALAHAKRADLLLAHEGLAVYYRDALLLLDEEIARRGA